MYQPLLEKSHQNKILVSGNYRCHFAFTLSVIWQNGGEFIPQLQRRKFARFTAFLLQGSSLSQSIETSMQASKNYKEFDEVKMVVGKTGAVEVPTDPMPPEATDLMVILKPPKRMEKWQL